MKKIVSIQDISCFGKCSLTAALPITSAMGIETAIIPTAVLSTHTGGFTGYTFRDLTDDIQPIADHWASIPLSFDAIYTGYLGSERQLDIVSRFFDRFGKSALRLCRPGHGRPRAALYRLYPKFRGANGKAVCKSGYYRTQPDRGLRHAGG